MLSENKKYSIVESAYDVMMAGGWKPTNGADAAKFVLQFSSEYLDEVAKFICAK